MKYIKTFESITSQYTIEAEDGKIKFTINKVISYYTVHYKVFTLDVENVTRLPNGDYEFEVSATLTKQNIRVTKPRIDKIIEDVNKGLTKIVSKPIDDKGQEFTLKKG